MKSKDYCIGILSRWNATCGVSLHAEMIGREFLRNGIQVKVFAPYLQSASKWWHHISIREDEPYVIRCFEEISPEGSEGRIDMDSVLKERLDALIVESWPSLSKTDVETLVWELKKRGVPSYLIVHDALRKDIKYGSLNIFEKVLIFHEGFKEIIDGKVDEDRVHIVPYPCVEIHKRERQFAEDGIIRFFSFGRQPEEEYLDYLETLKGLERDLPSFSYKVIRCSELLPYKYGWLEQEKRVLDLDGIYDNLLQSDIHLIPKGRTEGKVVSSTLFQTMGSLCISIAPDTNYFEDVKRCRPSPIVLYSDRKDLKEKILKVVHDKELRDMLVDSAKRYITENNIHRIAYRILSLINPILIEDFKEVINL